MKLTQEQNGQIIHRDIDDGVNMLLFGLRPDDNARRDDVDLRPSPRQGKVQLSSRYLPLEAYRVRLRFMIIAPLFVMPIIGFRSMMWLAILLALPIALAQASQPQSAQQCRPLAVAPIVHPV